MTNTNTEEGNKRFIKTTAEEVGEEPDTYTETEWWLDTLRPILQRRKGDGENQKFIAIQTYKGKDPNDFVKCEGMQLLFTDQAEYYFVCKHCYFIYSSMQWSGGTRASSGWRERAEQNLKKHEEQKGWCDFCDPIFGNGGWHLD